MKSAFTVGMNTTANGRASLWPQGSFDPFMFVSRSAYALSKLSKIKHLQTPRRKKPMKSQHPLHVTRCTVFLLTSKHYLLGCLFCSSLQCRGLNLRCHACEASALPLSHIPSPDIQFLIFFASAPFSRCPQGQLNYSSLRDEGEDDWSFCPGAESTSCWVSQCA